MNSAVGATHFIASQMDGRFRVEAGCFSRHEDVNTQTGEHWKIAPERRYPDWGEMLAAEQGRLDAIVVLTPTPDHQEPVLAAIRAGYAVVCEKALATSSADAAEIKKALADNGGFLAVTYNYTGYPMVRELRHMLAEGRLGTVQQIHIEMPQEGYLRLDDQGQPLVPQDWRLRDQDVPTVALDLGVHVHHLIDFLSGEKPKDVVALQSSLGSFRQVVDNTMCIARYSNDLVSNIWYSKAALGQRNGLKIRVFGEEGSAEWYQMDPEFLVCHDNHGRKTIVDRASSDADVSSSLRYNRFKSGHPSGFLEAFANLYWDIAEALKAFEQTGSQDSDFVFTVEHAQEGLVMFEAIAKSSKAKSWQTVTFP